MEADRDQLALAAKAAGKARADWDYDWLRDQGREIARDMLWDPRRDSGQALELAAMLRGSLIIGRYAAGFTLMPDGFFDSPPEFRELVEEHAGDRLKAARLAIFRAAVEIGRSMP